MGYTEQQENYELKFNKLLLKYTDSSNADILAETFSCEFHNQGINYFEFTDFKDGEWEVKIGRKNFATGYMDTPRLDHQVLSDLVNCPIFQFLVAFPINDGQSTEQAFLVFRFNNNGRG
ncbi:MAG: hypothetical protein HRT88_11975 [Lentisphaeraceae bacterium]|nr:hypothetical protein [Lentisphaeraceae bacterium]